MIIDLIEPKLEKKIAEKLSDPVTFIETFLKFKGEPLKLYPYQKRIASETNFLRDRIVLQKARQIGGSLIISACIVYWSYVTNDAVFILVSKTAEQSGFIASYVRRFFESNPILAEIIDRKKTSKGDLWLKNGTVIYNRTAGNEGENLRGISCEGKGCLIFDESSYIPDKAHRALIHVAHGCGVAHCSTPRRPNGVFHTVCHSEDYKRYKVSAKQSGRISTDEIDKMRRLLRPSEYKTDVLGEFAAGENVVFDSVSIENAINHDAPLFDCHTFDFGDNFPFTSDSNKNYVYSLDVSQLKNDAYVLSIGDLDRENNTMEVVAYHSWIGTSRADDEINATITDDPNTIMRDIIQYTRRFCCRKFYIDATSNEYFGHQLLNQHLIPVEPVIWSLQRKEKLVEHLATTFRAEKMCIPNDPEMVNELLEFSYDLKKQKDDSEKKIYLAGNPADDYVASLAMLAQAITGEQSCVGVYIAAW